MTRIARTMMWGEDYEAHLRVLGEWRGEGSLAGVTVCEE
jgi:hypothetical protein